MRGASFDPRRLFVLLLPALLALGCGPRGPAPASAPTSQAAGPSRSPFGWWIAVDNPQARYRVAKAELVALLPENGFERRALQCEQRSPTHWACATGRLPFALRVDGEHLLLEAPDGVVRARSATDAEVPALEQEVAKRPDLATACARAKRCFVEACPLRGITECVFDREVDGTSLRQCEGTRDGVRVHLEELKKPVPADCQAE
ncbi:MAG TPA: hypothetical protein VGQ83_10050 [Polyangia bacterium]|jgi:hypothetical protein